MLAKDGFAWLRSMRLIQEGFSGINWRRRFPRRFLGADWLNKFIFFQTALRTNLGIGVAEQACDLKFFLWLPMSLIDAGKWRVSG
jgi:hypothetical protein